MDIIGRKKEQIVLENCLASGRPEFLVVYGRRRVGKTYLIKEFFHESFSFYATGVAGVKTKEQLKIFQKSLQEYGSPTKGTPQDWFEAFERLKELLLSTNVRRDAVSGRLVVFLDELPWMDTARSDFKSALDYFWNSWASAKEDLLFIVCGSAASWIIEHLLSSTGGFYNRITRQIYLKPFCLKECAELIQANGIVMSSKQVIQSYMIFGGIPYYWNCFDRRLSLAQNIEELCFNEYGQLHYEYDRLLASLFRNPGKHMAVIRELSNKRGGLTRVELSKNKEIGDGEMLTKTLSELEQSGFIRKYRNGITEKQGFYFQLIDPYIMFYLTFLENKTEPSWLTFLNTPGYYSWCGLAFEMVCLQHIDQIKQFLGIPGVSSYVYTWKSKGNGRGAQIDLLIDRKDDVINVCEMKFSEGEFYIDKEYETKLLQKMEVFREQTKTQKALHLTMITSNGIGHNAHSGIVIHNITGEDLFNY